MRHCGSKPARYSWQCIAPKTQHQKYIAPKTKKQCTKDALHNSNRTNEAPPKMPLHSIPKVHIHNTRDAMHRRCSAPKKYCNQYAAHHRCIASYMQLTKDVLHQRYIPPKMHRSINASHQRYSSPKIKRTRDAAYLALAPRVCRSPPVLLSLHNHPRSYEGSLKASPPCPCTRLHPS